MGYDHDFFFYAQDYINNQWTSL